MRRTIPLLLIAALVLSSCGRIRDSRINPFNWFGRAESRQVTGEGEVNPLIPRRSALAPGTKADTRVPVQQITELSVDRHPNGAIIRATAVTQYQGAYQLGLKKVEGEEVPAGTLRFIFVAYQPARVVGPVTTRTVVAATQVSSADLAGVRRVEVVGAANVLTSRR